MKKILRLTVPLIITIIGITGFVQAQSIPDSVIIKTDSPKADSLILVADSSMSQMRLPVKSHFEAGMSFQSNDVYLGRKDSIVLPYYIPEFSYYHKSGLYATASLNYLKNSTASRIDLVTLEGGYIFSTGNYDGQFTASKYFYNSQSTSVTSEITAGADYQNSYDFGFVKPTFTVTLNIGTKLDFAGLFGIEHSFYLFDDKLDFTPTFAFSGSTQNYYSDYYKKRVYSVKKKGQTTQTGIASITGTVLNASTFKILDYEPTIPINYKIGKAVINFTPTYSIPVHPATIAVQSVRDDGTIINRTRLEKIDNTFYWTLGISFLF
jgi:hypothetical protein